MRGSRRPERISIDVISGKVIAGKDGMTRRNLAIMTIALAFAVCAGGSAIRGSNIARGAIGFGAENATAVVGADDQPIVPVTRYRTIGEVLRSASPGRVDDKAVDAPDRQGGANGQSTVRGNYGTSSPRGHIGKPNEPAKRPRSEPGEAARDRANPVDRANPGVLGRAPSEPPPPRRGLTILPQSYWTGASWRWRPEFR